MTEDLSACILLLEFEGTRSEIDQIGSVELRIGVFLAFHDEDILGLDVRMEDWELQVLGQGGHDGVQGLKNTEHFFRAPMDEVCLLFIDKFVEVHQSFWVNKTFTLKLFVGRELFDWG